MVACHPLGRQPNIAVAIATQGVIALAQGYNVPVLTIVDQQGEVKTFYDLSWGLV